MDKRVNFIFLKILSTNTKDSVFVNITYEYYIKALQRKLSTGYALLVTEKICKKSFQDIHYHLSNTATFILHVTSIRQYNLGIMSLVKI